jgi:hypothetical protein
MVVYHVILDKYTYGKVYWCTSFLSGYSKVKYFFAQHTTHRPALSFNFKVQTHANASNVLLRQNNNGLARQKYNTLQQRAAGGRGEARRPV